MTPADLAALDADERDAHADRIVSAALEGSGFDPLAMIERCRARHRELGRRRGIGLDDFEAGSALAAEVLRKGLDEEADKVLAALERTFLSALEPRNRHERRRLEASTRAQLKAGRKEMQAIVRQKIKTMLHDAQDEYSDAEDDFSRMMREAMEG